MQEIHIMSGIPASGKTTYAERMVEENPQLIHISRDKIRAQVREEVQSTEYFPISQAEEWQLWTTIINSNILSKQSVIIDQTTLDEKALTKLVKSIVIPEDATIIIHLFLVSLPECQFRNGFREGFEYVPPKAIKRMYEASFKSLPAISVQRLLVEHDRPLVGVRVCIHK